MTQDAYPESRRIFLRHLLASVPPAIMISGVAAGATGCSGEDEKNGVGEIYKPIYFTEHEFSFLVAAVDVLIPADKNGPGALQAGVPEFIDRQMETAWGYGKLWYMHGPFHPDAPPELGYQLNLTPRELYRMAIADCDSMCKSEYGKYFSDLAMAEQVQVLSGLESGKVHLLRVPSVTFFEYFLSNTKEGFFSDPMYGGNKHLVGWKMLGFPGARADFADWVMEYGKKYPYGPVSIDGEKG